MRVGIECVRAGPGWEQPLGDFLTALAVAEEEPLFHPHPLTAAAAEAICNETGGDLYYLLVEARTVLAYGMLRGWDQGYEVPSLGIAVHPDLRGSGLALLLMGFLHAAAARRGARAVRLRVRPDNKAAIELYRSLGYVFVGEERGQLVARLEL
jgi:ribosomal protein S18 acetylase RimI-like enzyme